jgi:hypothetical protein
MQAQIVNLETMEAQESAHPSGTYKARDFQRMREQAQAELIEHCFNEGYTTPADVLACKE